MADATITATSVLKTASTVTAIGIAGAAITAGQILYADSTANFTLKPTVATVLASAAAVGVALNSAAVGQPVIYATSGDVNMNTLVAGTVYVVSANAGGLAPSADLDASIGTNYGTIVGISTGTGNLRLAITASGVVNP